MEFLDFDAKKLVQIPMNKNIGKARYTFYAGRESQKL